MNDLVAIAVLPARDLERGAAFYARLGFEIRRRYRDYLILGRARQELHLRLCEIDPTTNPAGLYVRVEDVDGWAERFGQGAEEKPWGQREVTLEDPDGNLVRIGAPILRPG